MLMFLSWKYLHSNVRLIKIDIIVVQGWIIKIVNIGKNARKVVN